MGFERPPRGGPEYVLIETFDFLELCCGPHAPLSTAVAARGFRVGPRTDILAHGIWDLTEDRVLEWIVLLVERRRVLWIHAAPTCATFSVAMQPALRRR